MAKFSTKRALLASAVSLLLCISMLVGSTLAWFTDSATAGVNDIVSGKLDVTLMMKDKDGEWVDAEGQTLDFIKDKNAPADEPILWEPGCAYQLPEIKVVNGGNLALKYEIAITGINGDAKLNEVIDWYVNDTPMSDYTFSGNLAAEAETEVMTIKGCMRADATNEYQDLKITGVSITVMATQLNSEFDSFGPDYDKYSNRNHVNVANQEELYAAIKAATEPTAILVADGTYALDVQIGNKDIVFIGSNGVTFDLTNYKHNYGLTHGTTLTFDGVIVKWSEDNEGWQGFTHSTKITYDNCTIYGTQFMYADADFINCTFEAANTAEKGYAVYGRGIGTLTFTGCTFNTDGRAIMLYEDSHTEVNVVMSDCVFKDNGNYSSKPKAIVETGDGSNKTSKFNINISDCMAVGFDKNGMDNVFVGNKDNIPADRLTVVIDNVNVVNSENDIVKIGTADELFAFANDVNANGNTYSGKLVMLTADIDLGNKAWTPIGQTGATQFLGTFDGKGYTISNLSINNTDASENCATGLFGWIERHGEDANYLMAVKNVKIDGANVTGHHNVAVIAGYLIGTIENCHVKNATVNCTAANDDANGDKAGVIAGIAAEAKALITGCTATDSTVSAGRDAGQIVGACIVGKVENCSATNVTVTSNGSSTGKNIANALIGRTN